MLLNLQSNPDYVNYLAYIFTSQQQLAHLGFQSASLFNIRYSAAINLKNFIKNQYKSIPKQTLAYIKTSVLSTLQDNVPQLRSFAGTIITEIVQQGGLLQWPEVLQELLALVGNQTGGIPPDTQEGAMSALAKVCEDNRKILERDYQGQRPMTAIVPRLLDFTTHPDARIRIFSLKTLRNFISAKSPTLFSMLDLYLGKISELTSDPNVEVKRFVCQSLVELVNSSPDILAPHIGGLVDFILAQQQNSPEHPDLALDAAEFWLAVGEQEMLRGLLRPYLEHVIPVLLAGMVYGEDEIAELGGDRDNADEEDRVEDLKPKFAAAKVGRGIASSGQVNGTDTPDRTSTPRNDLSDGEVDESDEEEDDLNEEGDPEDLWSLRKCSAAALDVMAVNFGEAVFLVILPYLKENLSHPKWPKREAAVLTLGAIAEGCQDIVAPHLPELVPFLISLLNDKESVVRQITCWCLGRYSEWASHLQNPNDRSRFFEPMMQGLLERMLDRNKKVQEAAASAFASLEEKAGPNLTPYTEPILRRFTECFTRYKDRNMYIIYDCIQTLADNVGPELRKPQLVDLLMPVLLNRWNTTADEAREMFPLMACLGYIAGAYGDSFSTFAPPIFARCVKIIFQNLRDTAAAQTNPALEVPDSDFIVTSLDLLSAILQALDSSKSRQLVSGSTPPFFPLLANCMDSTKTSSTPILPPDIRQSAFALLGDCAITFPSQLLPHIPLLMPLLIHQLSLDLIPEGDTDSEQTELAFNVLNNVCWSCGEIGAKVDPDNSLALDQNPLAPYVTDLHTGLLTIMQREDVPESVNENASVALGRLGISCPQLLGSTLGEHAATFLESVAKIGPSEEKASAFLGFNKAVMLNPGGLGGEGVLSAWFTEATRWPFDPALMGKQVNGGGGAGKKGGEEDEANGAVVEAEKFAEVRESFGRVVKGFRTMFPENDFRAFLDGQLTPEVRERLGVEYAWALS